MGAELKVSNHETMKFNPSILIFSLFRLQKGKNSFCRKFTLLFNKVFLCDCYFYLHKTINISCCLINRLQCREKHFTTTNQKQIHKNYFCLLFIWIQICSTDDCTKVRLSGRRQDPEDTFYSVPWELTLGRR